MKPRFVLTIPGSCAPASLIRLQHNDTRRLQALLFGFLVQEIAYHGARQPATNDHYVRRRRQLD